MDQLVLTNKKGDNITTSLIIAETFGKEHKNVLRDIQELACSEEFRRLNFEHTPYVHPQNKQTYPMYEITKDGFSFLVMGYTGEKAAEFKETFILEFNKRDAMLKSDDYILLRSQEILTNRMKALEAVLEQKDRRLELQQTVIRQSAPKVEYYEEVLTSNSSHLTNTIAKELGMSATTLNKRLDIAGIQYKQAGSWVLRAKYQGRGLTKTKTYTFNDNHGKTQTSIQTVWTEKGREFIHKVITSQKVSL